MKRDFISVKDLTIPEIEEIFDLAAMLKKSKGQNTDHLSDQSVALVFQKPSNRTRVSFEVGIGQMGGNCIYLGPKEIDLGKRESTADVAKTLSRYLDAIVARTYTHQDIVDLAKNADIPIINGLSDLLHPCQAMADLFSIKEKFGTLDKITVAYIGDGNNVCHSLMLACAKLGVNINVGAPKGYEPDKKIVAATEKEAQNSGAKLTITTSPADAVKKAHVIYTDVWTSMGQEEETEKRLKIFEDFQINEKLVKNAADDYIFMHCLPAHRGQEVTAKVIDGDHSIVFDQAENRMHIQKAILFFLLREK